MIHLKEYNGHAGIYLFTTILQKAQQKVEEGFHVFLLTGSICTIYENNGNDDTYSSNSFIIGDEELASLKKYTDGDVLEISENGIIYERYTVNGDDCTLFVSAQCNSACIMCPCSSMQRKKDSLCSLDSLMECIRYLPNNTGHITITGGEPFLLKKDIFRLLRSIKERLPETECLILTNGRVFADIEYMESYIANKSRFTAVGIPIHGSTGYRHDKITRSDGSFEQTILGIKHLLYYGEKVEIRFVISKLNADDILNMTNLILQEIPGVTSVKLMGLEMLGDAAINQNKVWIDYESAGILAEKAADLLLQNGIDVELYNFPLCVIEQKYWAIYRKSIDDYKIRYKEECEKCVEKDNCGGIFAGTLRLVDNVYPILNG